MKNLKEKFNKVRQQTEKLVSTLSPEDFVVQPVVDVSPPKWHLAHTTWFFEQFILCKFDKNYQEYDKDFNFLFNSYYESVGKRVLRANRGNLTRPGVKEVLKYRAFVNEKIDHFLENQHLTTEMADLMELGLQHEQQHQELLITDIKYILGNNPLFPTFWESNVKRHTHASLKEDYTEIEGGIYKIGYEGDGFHFDNEEGVHQVFLQPYRFMNRLITNGEYLEFIEAGGYKRFEYWLMEGWEWVKAEKISAPFYWHQVDNQWYYYTLNGFEKIDLYEPVTHISFFEADAYASWRGKRLMTEFEWEVAGKKAEPVINGHCNFVDSESFRPKFNDNQTPQMFGDTWEWTSSAYLPYPYFKKAAGAIGEYNGKFMVNQKVLRGGSCATPADHIRHTYRNFFHPHLRWQFTGVRLAEHI
ncbi:ergothioneine biosynthesis protein EgtB [Fulvivirgaceae bacterium BMA12]|uniref:Ergothioneine biosynthesis protein EgtB n=1 Tax=Agaribacillus aureus TaxID=3051825 RepID=A0ABT8L3D4_9BACT|nr:ergothioneine biosynthesis protein EgtB [Fulvivirgaceae bacterium BMA12]